MKNLKLPTQLLVRDIDKVFGQNLLVVEAPEPEAVSLLRQHLPEAKLTFFNFDYAIHKTLVSSDRSINAQFHHWYEPEVLHDTAIIYLPKSDALIETVFSMVSGAMASEGTVFVVGQKNAGIKSQKKVVEHYFGPISVSDAARHSVIYQATKTRATPPNNSLEEWVQTYRFVLGEQSFPVVSLPGVFSHGKLDDGTRMLLENLPTLARAKVLDWGCGSGVIGLVIQKMFPQSEVSFVDSNALALEATRRTLLANGLSVAPVWATDVFSDVADRYDLIVSNPPFHSGIETQYTTVEKFLAEAKSHLQPQGSLIIVANTFLRYKPLLEKQFGHCHTVAENKSYRVYQATNP